jgi:hypothetical protein
MMEEIAAVSRHRRSTMYSLIPIVLTALLFFTQQKKLLSQASGPRTLVAALAYADDENPAAAIVARHARVGVQVDLLIASDGGQALESPPRAAPQCHQSGLVCVST